MARIQLRRASFEKWLESQPDLTVVGETQRPCHCPVATWLNTRPDVHWVDVGSRTVTLHRRAGPSSHQRLPAWTQQLIRRVDALYGHVIGKPVTACQARAVLALI